MAGTTHLAVPGLFGSYEPACGTQATRLRLRQDRESVTCGNCLRTVSAEPLAAIGAGILELAIRRARNS